MWTQEGLSLSLCMYVYMYVYMYVLYNLVHLMPICNDLQSKYASFRYLHAKLMVSSLCLLQDHTGSL